MANEWLKTEHPVYTAQKALWERMERRFYGGEDVLEELVPFRWEATSFSGSVEVANPTGQRSLDARKLQASYINYPNLFARTMVGHIMRSAPGPEQGLSLGTLGEAGRREGDESEITRAELLYFNADGVGNDGSQWDNFWSRVAENSFATGHRWLMVEAPERPPQTYQDELDGLRPYLVEYSPLLVTNWHFTNGQLDFAIVSTSNREPRIENGQMAGNASEASYLLMVRAGFEGFGEAYRAGGWWEFDADLEPTDKQGTWEKTRGEIPMWVHYYERSKRENRISRPGIVEISQSAVAYMNLSSAADYDAWEAAASILYIIGADKGTMELIADQTGAGAKLVPVKIPDSMFDKGQMPQIYDGSTGAVTAGVFETRLQRKQDEAMQSAALEATSEPGSSGVSKMAGFADSKAPRLTLLASEMESSQNTAIRFAELRWQDAEPEGAVTWKREFELLPLIDSIREVFELAEVAEVRSRTLTENGIMSLVGQKGLAKDDAEFERIRAEIGASFDGTETVDRQTDEAIAEESAAAQAIRDALGATGPGDTEGIEGEAA